MNLIDWLRSLPKADRIREKTTALRNLSTLFEHTNNSNYMHIAGEVARV